MNITVKSVETKPYRHLFAQNDTLMTVVYVEIESRGEVSTLGFSQHEDEVEWFADSHIGPGLYPHFVHGEGDRSVRKSVAQGVLHDAIVEAVS